MNIKREFLYSEEKIIPIQLLKTSYAVSHPLTTTNFEEVVVGINSRQLEIKFPLESSNIVMSLDASSNPVIIKEVRSAPPGTTSINIKIEEGSEYNIYVISREYDDGYIKGNYRVEDSSSSSDKLSVTYDSAHDFIDLSDVGALTKSRGRDSNDTSQWYGYDGFYEGPLIWSAPIVPGGEDGQAGEYTYLIYYRDILNDMVQIFKSNGISTTNTPTTIESGIKTWKSHDELVRYLNRLDADQFLRNINQISDLIGYLRESNNLREEYVTLTWDSHELVDGMLSVMYYGNARSSQFTDSALFGWVPDPNNDYYDSNGGRYDPWDNYYAGLKSQTVNTELLTKYTNTTALASEIWGIANGGSAHKSFWDSGGPQAWSRGPDDHDLDGPTARRDFAAEVARKIRERKNTINDDLQSLGLPIGTSGEEPIELENVLMARSTFLVDNILGYIEQQLVETDITIQEVGDELFCGIGGEEDGSVDMVITGYNQLDLTIQPDWFDISIPWESFTIVSGEDPAPRNQGVYNTTWVWDNLISDHVLEETRGNIQHGDLFDLDGIDRTRINVGSRTNPIWINILTESNWNPLTYYLVANMDLLYVPRYGCPTCTGQTEDQSPEGEDGYFPQTQEAILQNIRFLKDLINSVDENLWTSYNSTSALMLASLISLRDGFEATPLTTTIMNITDSTVRNENIEVVWKMIGPSDTRLEQALSWAQGWQPLQIPIVDIGNGTKILNLSSEEFNAVGKYVIMIRPRRLYADVVDLIEDYAMVRDDLGDYETRNYFYGYNAQFYNPTGELQGDQKIIVEYNWSGQTSYLKFSPLIENFDDIDDNIKVELWSNEFIPQIIEVDIVEHNALTLSYAAYAKKELNTTTGLCVIYDHNGNEYKKLSFGKFSNGATNGAIIEYRTPEDDTDGY